MLASQVRIVYWFDKLGFKKPVDFDFCSFSLFVRHLAQPLVFRACRGVVLRLCSMIVRLTLRRSMTDHAKTSLLRFRQSNNLSLALLRYSLIRTISLGTEAS